MTTMFVRALVLATSAALVASISGCAAADADDAFDGEESTDVESAAKTPGGSTDPLRRIGPTQADITAQGHVTAAFNYALGGGSSKALLLNHACTTGTAGATAGLLDALNSLKQNLEDGHASLVGEPTLTSVKGLKAVSRGLQIHLSYRPSINSPPIMLPPAPYLQDLTDSLAACWGDDVRPFAYLGTSDNLATAYFDPEPAVLTQTLSGSTGASAAAVFSSSSSSTTVRYWGGSYQNNTLGLTAGTPCSISGLASGGVAIKVIQVAGSFAKCI